MREGYYDKSKNISLVRGSILEGLVFRTSLIVSIIGNLLYLIIIYFLWKAILIQVRQM